MRKSAFLIATLVAAPAVAQSPAAASANPAPTTAAANVGVGGAKALWTAMTTYVTQAAEQMPEADYSFKPVATVRTFGELVGHVAGAQNMICAASLGEPQRSEDEIEKSAKTKAALVAALKASTEYCSRAYAQSDAAAAAGTKLFGQDMSRMQTLVMNAAHNAEHYGNIVTYMRIKGMVPPSSQPAPTAAAR